jgi:hypothetical protein
MVAPLFTPFLFPFLPSVLLFTSFVLSTLKVGAILLLVPILIVVIVGMMEPLIPMALLVGAFGIMLPIVMIGHYETRIRWVVPEKATLSPTFILS